MPEWPRRASKVRPKTNEIVASKPAQVLPAKEPEMQDGSSNSRNVDESHDGINGDGGSALGLVIAGTRAATPQIDDSLSSPELYLNRELTWLGFNRRVLSEAEDEKNPLLERLKFLAISGSNLDEFFMKRIGGLKHQVAAGIVEKTVDGRTPQQQITECYTEIRQFEPRQQDALRILRHELNAHGVQLLTYEELTNDEQSAIREHYLNNVFP